MDIERIHPDHDRREHEPRERGSTDAADDAARPPTGSAPRTSPSEPPAFRTWHPDTCDERRLRRGAR